MNYPKRLIEVDLPIRRISEHARREKSIRHGHISTLHIWWARRPLAACRAVLCASLWPDPVDPLCPQAFRDAAAESVNGFSKAIRESETVQKIMGTYSGSFLALEKGRLDATDPKHWNTLRYLLFDFIAQFAAWEASTEPHFLETARKLTQSAHEALGGAPGTRPLVVDPFAGGGSIPLEALRIGADAFASDLNPVAVLLNKVVLEYIPKYGQRLGDEVRKWGQWIKVQAEKELAEFYPKDPDGATPIAYLWARTITCEGPVCGVEVPMVRSPWIIKTDRLSVAFKVYGARTSKEIEVEICKNPGISDVITTVKRGSAICPLCGYTTPAENVRKQFLDKRGGANDSRLMAVVTLSEGVRDVRLPQKHDYDAFVQAKGKLSDLILAEPKATPSLIPDEPLPYLRSIFNIQLLGVKSWGDLFNARQALAIATLASKVKALSEKQFKLKDVAFGRALKTILAFAVDRQADSNTSLCSWRSSSQDIGHTFGRQALPIVWDYVECNLFSGATRDWSNAVEGTLKAINGVIGIKTCGEAHRASATQQSLPDDSSAIFFTDPPYYDLVPYADLSDFFYVWLKRMIAEEYPELFSDDLTPKLNEIVQLAERNPTYAYKTRENYEGLMCKAMQDSRRVLQPCGIGIVVFAHKGTDVWEIQLDAMIRAGWIICASWPIDTEMGSRLRARNSAALASSVHLICRPRENFDGSLHTTDIGDWRDVLRELPERIHEWLPRLADEGVVGADAIFACLGPALEVFSRYSRVEKASGEVVTLREYLEQVWAAVSKEALALVFKDADTSGFEEDARLTAMWLWTLSANQTTDHTDDTEEEDEEESGEEGNRKKVVSGGYTLEYDAARKIAQGLGAHLEALTSLVEVKGDKATLLPVMARTRKLFGKEDTSIQDRQAEKKAKKAKAKQMDMFVTLEQLESELAQETGSVADTAPAAGSTTLDRVHQTMILFGAGRSEAMKRFLVDDGIGNDPRFWSLAQALSALYPPTTEEKRWVDGVLARKKGLGF